jgi:hypothetical protein
MRNWIQLLLMSLIIGNFCFFNAMSIQGQDTPVTASVKEEDGLESVSFDTLNGRVEVDLPDDLADGDTISGTVLVEPKGEEKEKIAQNEDELSGIVVEIEKTNEVKEPEQIAEAAESDLNETRPAKEIPPESHGTSTVQPVPEPKIEKSAPYIKLGHKPDQGFTCQVPPNCGEITIVLREASGKELCRKQVRAKPAYKSLPPISQANPPVCKLPTSGQCGKALLIEGRCDGRSATSRVKINGRACRVLAESPRRQIARMPKDSSGKCTIERAERGFRQRGMIELMPAAQAASTPTIVPPSMPANSGRKASTLNGEWLHTFSSLGGISRGPGYSMPIPGYGTSTQVVTLRQDGNQVFVIGDGQEALLGTLEGNRIVWRKETQHPGQGYTVTEYILIYDPTTETIEGEGQEHQVVTSGSGESIVKWASKYQRR